MRADQVQQNLANLSWELTQLHEEYARHNVEARKAMSAYKVDYARALLSATGPMDERKAKATVVTAEALLTAEVAEAVFDNTRTALRVLGQRLDAGRTIASTIRAEALAAGTGT